MGLSSYNKKEKREYNKNWVSSHKGYHAKWKREYRQKQKLEIFRLFGNKCVNPFNLPHPDWLNSPELLQIDHINGGGNQEYRGGNSYYNTILKSIEKEEKKYQLLCVACNWIKRCKEHEDNRKELR